MYVQDQIFHFLLPFLIITPLAIIGGVFIIVIMLRSFKKGRELNFAMKYKRCQ